MVRELLLVERNFCATDFLRVCGAHTQVFVELSMRHVLRRYIKLTVLRRLGERSAFTALHSTNHDRALVSI